MGRCNETQGLEVHHKYRNGSNTLENAEVLCQDCHKQTDTYGIPGASPLPFLEEVKVAAKKWAGNRCECTRACGWHK